MHTPRLQRLLWSYCPGYAGVSRNERADRLASTAHITSDLQLVKPQVLRGMRNFLNKGRPDHHSIDHLKERRVGKRSGRHSTLQGSVPPSKVENDLCLTRQILALVLRATLGRLLRDGEESVWASPSAMMPS